MARIDVASCIVILTCAVWLRPYSAWWFAGVGLFVVASPLWIVARVQFGDDDDRYRAGTGM